MGHGSGRIDIRQATRDGLKYVHVVEHVVVAAIVRETAKHALDGFFHLHDAPPGNPKVDPKYTPGPRHPPGFVS
jgi:hypothetical protein